MRHTDRPEFKQLQAELGAEELMNRLMWFGSTAKEFERVIKVMNARHGEHLVIIGDLMRQNAALKEKLKEKNA